MSHSGAAALHGMPKLTTKPSSQAERAAVAVESLRGTLPSQGPIDVFIHHNTLHDFEDECFEAAVEAESHARHAEPYLGHAEYLEMLAGGRIAWEDVEHALDAQDVRSRPVQLVALRILTERHTRATIRWALSEGRLLRDYAAGCADALIRMIESDTRRHVRDLAARRDFETLSALLSDPATGTALPREALGYLFQQGDDCGSLDDVDDDRTALRMLWNSLSRRLERFDVARNAKRLDSLPPCGPDRLDAATIRLTAAYLDRGSARWPMPVCDDGFLASAIHCLKTGERFLPDALRWIPRRHWVWAVIAGRTASEIIAQLLSRLGVDEETWPVFLRHELASVAGWAGMVSVFERRGTPPGASRRAPTLIEYVALRLILRVSIGYATIATVADDAAESNVELVRQVFLFCQLSGWSSLTVSSLSDRELRELAAALVAFGDVERRRTLQQAFERTFQRRMLAALVDRSDRGDLLQSRPSFQVAFCLDEREESLRRHLEEIDPSCMTYGAAGFFNVAVFFSEKPGEVEPTPLCPVVVTPRHIVKAQVDRGGLQRLAMRATGNAQIHSRRLVTGHLLAIGAGPLAAALMAVRVIFPRATRALARRPRIDALDVLRPPSLGAPVAGLLHGFEPLEMADRVEGLLRTIGLTSGFARVVALIGHGSTTANNPFASAYECGACGGHRGDRNGRILAIMANRLDVREILSSRGLAIPTDTVFVGGCHDTCSGSVELFDLDAIPAGHEADIAAVRSKLDRARAMDAHERSRRFDDAFGLTPSAALRHVEGRASSLREPRPEYGHGSNAWCFVGPRSTTRGLFLDRRSFLVSYEPKADPAGDILERILAAIVPVCAGISLEYYFSRVDNRRYGAGTKLPHNVNAMVGLMDGYLSDLRTGLPWQTVEIHEPMRLFIVVETLQSTLAAVISRLPEVERLVLNRWIHVAALDPETRVAAWYDGSAFTAFRSGEENLTRVPSSRAYYEGRSGHLWPVRIDASHVRSGASASPREEAR